MRLRAVTSRGFTLVELLVVIGIIGVLISMLLPALIAAREASKGVKCLSNLRQLAVAAQSYATSFKGNFPPAWASATDGTFGYSYNWDFTIVTNLSTLKATVVPGLLWAGHANPEIQQCPSYDGKSNTPYDPYTGYNYNTSYIGRGKYAGSLFDPPAKATHVRYSAQTALFGDGEFANGANKFMRSPQLSGYPSDTGVPRIAGTQGFRHRGRTNASFVDGHAETIKQICTGGGQLVAPGTGFLSEDNSLYDLN